ncbi:DgyrCDS574 [Dimorphilus gyrociliatus]|uniref:DgyrCDS574 n=1 Tax=Dimorphilus gyrociliatus TaxID=2664684 RepID=A0A7I8V513_9ANNE|nr:DgyrCDS574 [Dimorphilus gyrociliatus]
MNNENVNDWENDEELLGDDATNNLREEEIDEEALLRLSDEEEKIKDDAPDEDFVVDVNAQEEEEVLNSKNFEPVGNEEIDSTNALDFEPDEEEVSVTKGRHMKEDDGSDYDSDNKQTRERFRSERQNVTNEVKSIESMLPQNKNKPIKHFMPRTRQFRPKHRPPVPMRNKQHALDFLMAQTAVAAAAAPRRFPPPSSMHILPNLSAPAPPLNMPSGPRKILINPHFRGEANSGHPNNNFSPFNMSSGPPPPPFPSHPPPPFPHTGMLPPFDVVPGQPQMQNFGQFPPGQNFPPPSTQPFPPGFPRMPSASASNWPLNIPSNYDRSRYNEPRRRRVSSSSSDSDHRHSRRSRRKRRSRRSSSDSRSPIRGRRSISRSWSRSPKRRSRSPSIRRKEPKQKVKEYVDTSKPLLQEVDPEFAKKLEEQKKLREKVLRQKELRRLEKIQQAEENEKKDVFNEDKNRSQTHKTITKTVTKCYQSKEGSIVKTKKVFQTTVPVSKEKEDDDSKIIAKKRIVKLPTVQRGAADSSTQSDNLQISSDNKRRIVVASNSSKQQKTCKVIVEGLSEVTSKQQLHNLATSIGKVDDVNVMSKERKAIITFSNTADVAMFVRKYNKHMLDLSHISVAPFYQ